ERRRLLVGGRHGLFRRPRAGQLLARRRDTRKDFLLLRGEALDGCHEVRDQIVAPQKLVLDLGPRALDGLLLAGERVVGAPGQHQRHQSQDKSVSQQSLSRQRVSLPRVPSCLRMAQACYHRTPPPPRPLAPPPKPPKPPPPNDPPPKPPPPKPPPVMPPPKPPQPLQGPPHLLPRRRRMPAEPPPPDEFITAISTKIATMMTHPGMPPSGDGGTARGAGGRSSSDTPRSAAMRLAISTTPAYSPSP